MSLVRIESKNHCDDLVFDELLVDNDRSKDDIHFTSANAEFIENSDDDELISIRTSTDN